MTCSGGRVLVVEDERLTNWSLVNSLAKWGYDAQPVFKGAEAIKSCLEHQYDILLVDYQLPDFTGLEVARQMRKKNPHVRILLLTAFQLSELEIEPGLIDAYFNKPVDLQKLRKILASAPHGFKPESCGSESPERNP